MNGFVHEIMSLGERSNREFEHQLGLDLLEGTASGIRPTAVGGVVAGWAA